LSGGLHAVVFPGMAETTFGRLGRFMVLDPFVRAMVAEADEALGWSVLGEFRRERPGHGVAAQLAFMIHSLALVRRAERELGLYPDLCAGPSFGHRALLPFTGALDFPDSVRLAADLAHCERDYFAEQPETLVTHCFVRVPDAALHRLVADRSERGEWMEISARLDPGCYLVSMREAVLDETIAAIRGLGGYSLRTMRPAVHARRFGPLRERAAAILDRYHLADPMIPVIADHDGRLVTAAADLRAMLLDGFDRPLDWPATVRGLRARGVGKVWVTGADELFHRLRCTRQTFDVTAVSPDTVSSLRPVG
jgi:[acyl-carrier-protein] S-malonyltransferase